ncbi:exonuclease domain-containing protein [Cryobacterium arcticum]|uniref:DNA polymerase III subunit epsilon n=1 Tax=Cryobacterium arcticum TaxID=670052 RepID=A0A1B1BLQ3_9MICO|nr:exonuclease domain-containing protein [Cryobacterium arcticum]ANP73569.1 DNA polymerase III subunit epsilon [Cryobacterium arcticum]
MRHNSASNSKGYAVIDFETTGLFAKSSHRVIEVAVVHVDESGRITGSWDTLINPSRDLGRQDIHRIRAADIMQAPDFAHVAPQLIELLSGRVIVAHNARFDISFLLAELDRLTYGAGLNLEGLCTMQLARDFLPGSGRKLSDCCAAYDIPLIDAHRALADAVATAHLLGAYIADDPDAPIWAAHLAAAAAAPWPPFLGDPAVWVSRDDVVPSGPVVPASWLDRITVKMPEFAGPAEQLDYLALLDLCLLDRELSAHEAQALVQLAEDLGIDRATCVALHERYFTDLVALAWADSVLTEGEIADLITVAQLLGLPSSAVAAALQPPQLIVAVAPAEPAQARFMLTVGDIVVLTGEMQRPRADWHAELIHRGFVPGAGVTKKSRLVVAADPDSLSGKARKARDYGIPVVSEAGLSSLLERA